MQIQVVVLKETEGLGMELTAWSSLKFGAIIRDLQHNPMSVHVEVSPIVSLILRY